jgi:hypothetical protein
MSNDDGRKNNKPPLHTRFSKGRSGNPKGRPRGSRNTSEILREEADRLIKLTQKGKTQRLSAREVIIKQQFLKAMRGDTRAAGFILDRLPETPGETFTIGPDGKIPVKLLQKIMSNVGDKEFK